MNTFKTAMLIFVGGLAVIFILTLIVRTARKVFGKPLWALRFVWPFFIAEAWKFTRHDRTRWKIITGINVAVLASVAGLIITYKLAFAFNWSGHNWSGYEISWLGYTTYFVSCAHGHHNAVLWIIRAIVMITALNMFTALFMTFENCSKEILYGFITNKFFTNGQAKIEAIAPYVYLLKSRAGFHIKKVFEQLDAIQRASSIFLIGVGNAPPSGIMIIASKKGLPKNNLRLSNLPRALSRLQPCIGLSPIPVWWNWKKKRHTGIAGNTGDGKSNIARALCAQTNLADFDILNVSIDIEGVDWRMSKRLRNFIHVTDIEVFPRVMELLETERQKRVRLCLQANTNHHGVTDVLDLEDEKLWQNPIKVPRIYIYFDEFDTTVDLYGHREDFKRGLKLYTSFTKRGRKYGFSTVPITTRPDFETFKSARDQFRWIGVGNFRARAGAMIFEEDIGGWNEIGSFKYELESPYDGLGIGMAPEVPLAGADDSLENVLQFTSSKASESSLKLGDSFNVNLHRVQHDEELEKVHEAMEKYLAVPR